MSHLIKVKARPNQPIQFPPLCVHCANAATAKMDVQRRMGRRTRIIDVPLCKGCQYELLRRSAKEEQLQKIGWLASGVLLLLGLAIFLVLTPGEFGFGLRLLLAAVAAFGLAGTVFWLFHYASVRAELPAKRAVRQSAQIANFTWRTVTFAFMNELFAEQFRALNEARLMEI